MRSVAKPRPVACAEEVHAAIRVDRDTFLGSTVNHRPWPGAELLLAECPACGSSLSFAGEAEDLRAWELAQAERRRSA